MRIFLAGAVLVVGSIVAALPSVLDHLPYSMLESGYDSGFRHEVRQHNGSSVVYLDIGKKDTYRLFLKIAGTSLADVKGNVHLGRDEVLSCWVGDDGAHDGWIEIGLTPSNAPSSRVKFAWPSGTRLTVGVPRLIYDESVEAWDLYPDNSFPDSSVFANNRRTRCWITVGLFVATVLLSLVTFAIQNPRSPPPKLDAAECVKRMIAGVNSDGRSRTNWVRKVLELMMLGGIKTVGEAVRITRREPDTRDIAALYAGVVQFSGMYRELTEEIEERARRLDRLPRPRF
jgi:hypothetical protein